MRVVPVISDNGTTKFAIKEDDGSFWGQEWITGPNYNARKYPSWDTKARAESKLRAIVAMKKHKERPL